MKGSAFTLTLRAWPVITIVTIGLCSLTQIVAGWFGVTLPDQDNLELVRRCARQAFHSWRAFGGFSLLVAQVVVVMPVIEEALFRGLLFKAGGRLMGRICVACGTRATVVLAALSSALFSAAHYLFQTWPDAAFLALFFFGCAQCWLYRRTGRLWCAIANHALFNTTNLVLLFFVE